MSAAALGGLRVEPGRVAAPALSAAVHLVLLAVLMLGVRWQNPPAAPVEVELWEAPRPAPEPKVEPPPPPPAPKPEPRPEPRIEKPDIVEKPAPKPKPKPEPKPEPPKPKPVAKAPPKEPPKPSDAEAQRQIREQLAREQAQIALEQEQRQIREQLSREQAAAASRALATWVDKVRAKIRGNILLPPDIKGNPEAVFDVVQLPTGEVLSAKLRRSSGHRGYDEAVERAILKSSPLPRPERPDLFRRELELRFRPLD